MTLLERRPTPVFELSGVTYRYEVERLDSAPALDGITLTIEAGRRIALLGANGSGKSTLLRVLDALYFPGSGSVSFHGRRLERRLFEQRGGEHDVFAFDFRRRVGLVFQNPDVQLFNPTVFDEVAFAPLQMHWSKDEILQRVQQALDQLEITHLKNRPPHRLSGGEQKRVALASVLVLDPEVVLLDEPTAGLDPRSESQIIDLLMSWTDSGRTVITATHDLALVHDIADYCLLMQGGKLAAQGDPAAILNDQAMLERANLVHAHRHRHASGVVHSHPHVHPHTHPPKTD